jgi:hypothetical protein
MTFRIAALVLLAFLTGATVAIPKEKEGLGFKIPPGWKIGKFAKGANDLETIELIREGDDIKDWKEIFTIQSFAKWKSLKSPDDLYNELKSQREKECPGSTDWNIIDKAANNFVYEWHAKPCLGQPEQSEIAKIILGKYTCYVLHYAKKATGLSADERDAWIKKFSETGLGSPP